jgi:glycosyltransferase involved in cell wall biosynthesis
MNSIKNRHKLRVCYWPGRETSYSRTRVIIRGLKQADVDIELYDCSSEGKTFARFFKGFFKFLSVKRKSDLIMVGFFGHFIVLVVRLFTRKKIIFDAFVSLYQTMVFDRQVFKSKGLLSCWARMIDKLACHFAEKILLDTDQHIDYYVEEYGLNRFKFLKLAASADDSVFFPRPEKVSGDFMVHFHGEFQRLHGTTIIFQAAFFLPDIKFRIIGRGKEYTASRHKAITQGATNIEFLPAVNYEHLAELMSEASVCLGIFGETQKAGMVIPHKVYEALALGKAVITADTPGARELLENGKTALLCPPGDPQALAAAIRRLKEDESLRRSLGVNGRNLFEEKCRPEILGNQLASWITEILRDSR